MDAGAEIGRQGSLQVVGLGLLQHAQRPHQVAQQLGLQPVQLVPKLLVDLKNTKNPQKKHPEELQTPLFAARGFGTTLRQPRGFFFPAMPQKLN